MRRGQNQRTLSDDFVACRVAGRDVIVVDRCRADYGEKHTGASRDRPTGWLNCPQRAFRSLGTFLRQEH